MEEITKSFVVPYKLRLDFDLVYELIKEDEALHFDTETDGLYGPIVLAQFYQKSWPYVIMVRNPDLNKLKKVLDFTLVVAQFMSYDATTLQRQSNSRFIPKKFHDTFLAARLRYPKEHSFSLDNLMKVVLGKDPYVAQGLDKKVLQASDWTGALSKEQLVYAATDVYYLPDVYEICCATWGRNPAPVDTQSYKLDMIDLRHCLEEQNNGIPVDEKRRLAMIAENIKKYEAMNMPINVNSYIQVRKHLGMDPKATSDKLALAFMHHRDGNEEAGRINKAKKLLKTNSFLKKYKTPDGRVYGCFSPSARSGRNTCKSDNLQQIPDKAKKAFGVAKDSGRVLVYSDFSQIQLRLVCAVTGDRTMEKLYRSGKDIHTYVRDMIQWLQAMGKKGRKVTKTGNFNFLFGGGAEVFQGILLTKADLLLPLKDCYRFKENWKGIFKSVAAWQEQGIKDWKAGKVKSTPFGRPYLGKMMTDQLAIEIQGAEAEVAKLAKHRMLTQLKELNPEILLVNFVHDSFIFECDNDPVLYKEVCAIIADCMRQAWVDMSQLYKIKDLPLPVEAIVGYNWGDIEDEDIEDIYTYDIDVAKENYDLNKAEV